MSSIAAEQPRPLRGSLIAGLCLLTLALVAAMQPSTAPVPMQDVLSCAVHLGHTQAGGPRPERSRPARQRDRPAEPGRPRMPPVTFVTASGGHAGERIEPFDAFSAQLDAGDAKRLAAQPGVHAVSLNGSTKPQATAQPSRLVTSYNQSIGTDKVWDDPATGKGVGVAVIDTGIAGDLPDFRVSQTDAASRVVASAVINPDATTAERQVRPRHARGRAHRRQRQQPRVRRPAARRVHRRRARGEPDLDQGSRRRGRRDDPRRDLRPPVRRRPQGRLQHPRRQPVARVDASPSPTRPTRSTPRSRRHGSAASWSSRPRATAAPTPTRSQYAPGNDPYVISVGAVDDQGTKSTERRHAGRLVEPRPHPGRLREAGDRRAGRAHRLDAGARQRVRVAVPELRRRRGQYFRVGGTSMSAPMVAGAVADLLEEHPALTPDQVKGVLVHNRRSAAGRRPGARRLRRLQAYRRSDSNEGLEPNEMVDPATGEIDWDRSRWSDPDGAARAGAGRGGAPPKES